jgi:hypothetical protein
MIRDKDPQERVRRGISNPGQKERKKSTFRRKALGIKVSLGNFRKIAGGNDLSFLREGVTVPFNFDESQN